MMIELARVDATLDSNVQRIWDVLMDFGHPERLAPSIECAELIGRGVGAVRIVKSSRGLEIHERLIECDPATWRFRYIILDTGDMPFTGVSSYDCTVQLTALSDVQTQVVWRSEGQVTGSIAPIRAYLAGLYANAIKHISVQLNG